MKAIALLICLLPSILFAGFEHAPKSFQAAEGYVVFVDFKSANYDISYDASAKTVTGHAKIIFESFEEGMPAFDLVQNPSSFKLDDEIVLTKVIAPKDQATWFRIALKNIKPGVHIFEATFPITEGVSFTKEGVSNAFWFTDLGDRSYLEAYLPANFEYDQYKMVLNLDFKNLTNQKIFSNGQIKKFDNNIFRVEFPESYNASALYFHTAPVGRYPENNFFYHSIDGRNIPIVAYASAKNTNMETVKNKILQSLEGLEAKYGPFLHPTLTVFIAGSGGMEYCGATMTDLWALNHELTHSYFARGGLMPANGNAGWLDEAITSWSDGGAGNQPDISGVQSNMAGNSEYRRYTHSDAYTVGKMFMGYLNYKFQSSGGLTTFLNQMIQTDAFKPMSTEEFIKKMSLFYGENLLPLFKTHTYSSKNATEPEAQNPAHIKMTIAEMREFL